MYANIHLFVMGMVMGHGHMTRMLGRLSAVRVQSVRKRGYYGDGGGPGKCCGGGRYLSTGNPPPKIDEAVFVGYRLNIGC